MRLPLALPKLSLCLLRPPPHLPTSPPPPPPSLPSVRSPFTFAVVVAHLADVQRKERDDGRAGESRGCEGGAGGGGDCIGKHYCPGVPPPALPPSLSHVQSTASRAKEKERTLTHHQPCPRQGEAPLPFVVRVSLVVCATCPSSIWRVLVRCPTHSTCCRWPVPNSRCRTACWRR